MSANKVIFNTGITYVKTIFTAVISLYATRFVLLALGAEDYGLFSVIGGVIGMLSFLNAAMTTSTQRYLSHSLGLQRLDKVKNIFANSIIIHFVLGIVIVLVIELLGQYLIETRLKINPDRIDEARYIFHFVIISTFITIISVPYEAVINARENFTFLAIVGVFESILRLVTALSLFYLEGDLLIYYGFFTMLTAIIIRIIKRAYSKKKYKECHVSYLERFDLEQVRELVSFAGWNLFGTLCAIARNQGVAVLINLFYTTTVNAAYGIANQLNSQLMFFSSTMLSAIRPQIMKSEGANDRDRTIRLALVANKFAFYLFTFFATPFFFGMPYILKLWLKEVPEYSVEFCRCMIVLTFFLQLNSGLMAAVQAIGKIKLYQLIAGSIQLLVLPVGYILLDIGFEPYFIVLGAIFLELFATVFRIYYFNYLTKFSIKKYLIQVILNPISSLLPVILVLYLIKDYFPPNLLGLLILCITSSLIYIAMIYLIGLTESDKIIMGHLIKKIKNKIVKK